VRQLPPDWIMSTVGQAGEVSLGRQRAPKYHHGDGMRPYLRVANVFEDRIDTTDIMQMTFSDNEFERYRLQPGDVLLNEGQSPHLLGRPAIYRGQPPDVAFTNSLIRFRSGPAVTAEWALAVFRHYMRSRRFMRESRITTNIAHLSATRFNTVEFPIPPLAEQKRIVVAIEEQFSRLDAGVAAIDRAERLLLQWLHSATQAAFEFAAGSEPRLQRVPLGDLCERITKGTTPTSVGHKFTADGIRFIKVESLFEGCINHMKCAYISETAHADLARSQLKANDVLVSIAGTLGRIGLVSEQDVPANTNQALAIVRLKEPDLAPYVVAWLESSPVRHSLRTGGKGVGMGNLTLEQIRQLPIMVPSNDVRRAVLESIDTTKLTMRRAATDIGKSRLSAERLRSSILAAAFSGKLVSGDEPASALLERVAVESASFNGSEFERTCKPQAPEGKVTV
jgi:type I restriction enzyme, S subunit